MHMSPGVPIMKSTDLVNWKLVSYAYDTLANVDAMNLTNGQSTYGRGSWASSIRYHNGMFYVSTFAQTTGLTYIYSTKNIEKGPWKRITFRPSYHDNSLFFDDDGKVYLLYGAGRIHMVELNEDLVITFSVNPNGGNAAANPREGSKFTMTIVNEDRALAPTVLGQQVFYDSFEIYLPIFYIFFDSLNIECSCFFGFLFTRSENHCP